MQIFHAEVDARRAMICPVLPPYQDAPSLCRGAGCMAWRWIETHIHHPTNPAADLVPSSDTHGYCGLAGNPLIRTF